jgi:hypothetical protein
MPGRLGRANRCISGSEFGWRGEAAAARNQSLEITQITLARKRWAATSGESLHCKIRLSSTWFNLST